MEIVRANRPLQQVVEWELFEERKALLKLVLDTLDVKLFSLNVE